MLSTKIRFIWPSDFRGEDFFLYRNLIGRIYGRSSIKFAHFVPIRLQTWPTQAIPVPDWSIMFVKRSGQNVQSL
jgi:hypothetical protein